MTILLLSAVLFSGVEIASARLTVLLRSTRSSLIEVNRTLLYKPLYLFVILILVKNTRLYEPITSLEIYELRARKQQIIIGLLVLIGRKVYITLYKQATNTLSRGEALINIKPGDKILYVDLEVEFL